MKIFELILNYTQPFVVIIFIIAGISSLIVGKIHQGLINLCFALANWMIFYGKIFFK